MAQVEKEGSTIQNNLAQAASRRHKHKHETENQTLSQVQSQTMTKTATKEVIPVVQAA